VRPYDGRRILLVVAGGIAAYKAAHLTRLLLRAGAEVEVLLTEGGARFVGAASFEGLTGRPVHRDLWERPMAHIDLTRRADLAVVAPATASLIGRLARGLASDLAAATLLAADCPVLVCPAMNERMWRHEATRENVSLLRRAGVGLLGPARGELAEGEIGEGRMEEPGVIRAEIGRLLEPESPLRGRRVLVTAGPTLSRLDPVRVLTNESSGRMGHALAASAWRRGAEVVLVRGPGAAPVPHGPREVRVDETEEMLEALREWLPGSAALLMAAAPVDFRPRESSARKLKKAEGRIDLSLEAVPDVLRETRDLREREGVLTLGFALETEDAVEGARRKMEAKGLDLVVANEAGRPGVGPGAATNEATLLDPEGSVEEFPLMAKEELAELLMDRVERRLES